MINVDAGRLREPAAWLMVAAACFGTLADVRQLLFGDAFGASFAGRAALYLPQLVSPVTWALLVGAVLLASNFGPAVARLKILVYVAAGTLAVSVIFGFIGLLGGLFSGAASFIEKIEFLLEGLPLLALSALALLYLLPKAVPSGPRVTEFHPQSFRPDGGFGGGHPQQPPSSPIPSYAPGSAPQAPPIPGQAPFVPGPAAHDQAPQAPYGAQVPQESSAPYNQPALPPALPPAPGDAYASQASAAQAPGYGAPADDRSYGAPAGYGRPPAQPYAEQQQAPAYGEQSYASPAEPQAPAYGAPAEQQPAQPAEPPAYTPSPYVAADVQPSAPARPYEPPPGSYEPPAHAYAAPAEQQTPPVQPAQSQGYVPAPTDPQLSSYGQAEPQPAGYGQQGSAQPYTPSSTEPQLPSYGQAEPQLQPYSSQDSPSSYAPPQPEAAPASQQQPYTPADSHPGPPFDSQAQASFPKPPENYGQPLTGYSGAEFARQAEQVPHYPDPADARSQQIAQAYQQAESYQQTQGGGTEPQLRVPEYGTPGYDDPFGHPQASQSSPQWETPQASQSAPQWETPQASQSSPQWETPQASQSSPQWETPQASQSAPQWETPQVSQSSPQWETPQTSQSAPQWDSQASQSAPRWEPPAADATLRFDPAAYQNDPLNAPAPPQGWDSQPPIDPTAIYTPERPGQVTNGENSDRERPGPGQEQNTSWYGSDRREH
ncbi:hypothetical protein ACFFMN_13095 [Planobispora siamensis]|uniref:sulfite exporter TauE/SafE family protein n=1 Tax=Planobispora siamensis TaxID=936338 RepID=UPI00194FCEA3|nr:sulfite exporter TauE/SafE family protein [Planobispora siamensis]